MPLILRAAKRADTNRAGKEPIGIGIRIMKDDPHRMRILLVAVHHHQRPLPIRSLKRVCGHQLMPSLILNVSSRGKNSVHA